LYVSDYDFVLFHKLSFKADMRGLHSVFEEKLGAGIAEPGGLDHRANRAKDGAVALAKK
jgi:hypothetical protein